ncbi:MAG: hypothetical protein WCD20_12185 [Rhodomicrobium sp.]
MAGIIGVVGMQATMVTPPDTRFMPPVILALVMAVVIPHVPHMAVAVADMAVAMADMAENNIRLNHNIPIKTPH